MNKSSPKPQSEEETEGETIRDLVAAANHLRAAAVRSESELLHALADQIARLPVALFGEEDAR